MDSNNRLLEIVKQLARETRQPINQLFPKKIRAYQFAPKLETVKVYQRTVENMSFGLQWQTYHLARQLALRHQLPLGSELKLATKLINLNVFSGKTFRLDRLCNFEKHLRLQHIPKVKIEQIEVKVKRWKYE